MASSYGTKTVTETATLIISDNSSRRSLEIVNTDSSDIVYLGMDSNVTTANGLPLYQFMSKGQSRILGSWRGDVYGIVAAGQTADVRYWEVQDNG